MQIGKVSVLFCMLAPVMGVTVARFAPANALDVYGLAPLALGLAVFAALTLLGGLVGIIAHRRGSRAGKYTIAWSALSLIAVGVWAASFAGGL